MKPTSSLPFLFKFHLWGLGGFMKPTLFLSLLFFIKIPSLGVRGLLLLYSEAGVESAIRTYQCSK